MKGVQCYELFGGIALKNQTFSSFMRLSQPGAHFTAESTEAMQVKYLAQGNNILLPGFEPSTSASRNRHSNQTINMLRNR